MFTGSRARGLAVAERIDSGAVSVNDVMTSVFQLPVPMVPGKPCGGGVSSADRGVIVALPGPLDKRDS